MSTTEKRKWRGKSGQTYVEMQRINGRIYLLPEYQYDDGMSIRGTVIIPLTEFENLGFEEVSTQEALEVIDEPPSST